MVKRMFVMVDCIDGSGKGAIVRFLAKMAADAAWRFFDVAEFTKQTGSLPKPNDWNSAKLIITTEPTYCWIGAAIREELVRNPDYDALTVAEAFAADREIHYRKIIEPAIRAGKIVVSERGIASSLAYQVAAGIPEETILNLPGNRLALSRAPDYLVIAEISPGFALKRLSGRSGKQDDSYFERLPFLEKLASRYGAQEYRKIFESRGTKIIDLSTEGELGDTENRVRESLWPIVAAKIV